MNIDETEETTISAQINEWRSVKTLGSLLGEEDDLKRRMQRASAEFAKCSKVWNTNKIALKTKLKLYNALVIPILMYNAGTWAFTRAQYNKLDTYHRRQLRQLLKVKWPI